MSDEKPPEKKGKKKNIEIHVGNGIQGLAEVLAGLGGSHEGRWEPLFLLKDHPEVEGFFKAADERRAFLKKEAEALQAKSDKIREDLWKSVETYMQQNGLWPKGLPLDADPCLSRNSGVLMHHIHE